MSRAIEKWPEEVDSLPNQNAPELMPTYWATDALRVRHESKLAAPSGQTKRGVTLGLHLNVDMYRSAVGLIPLALIPTLFEARHEL